MTDTFTIDPNGKLAQSNMKECSCNSTENILDIDPSFGFLLYVFIPEKESDSHTIFINKKFYSLKSTSFSLDIVGSDVTVYENGSPVLAQSSINPGTIKSLTVSTVFKCPSGHHLECKPDGHGHLKCKCVKKTLLHFFRSIFCD